MSAWDIVPIGFLAALLLLTLLVALTPCTHFDAHAYHYALPKLWLERGNTHLHGVTRFELLPLNTEMLFMLGLALGGETLANLIGWVYTALMLAALYLFGRKWLPARAVLWATAIFASIPQVLLQAGGGGVDVAMALQVFLMGGLLERWRGGGAPGHLAAAGAFAGVAFATKVTAPIFLLGASVTVAVVGAWRAGPGGAAPPGWAARRQGAPHWLRAVSLRVGAGASALALFGGVYAVVASPWLVRNTLRTQNPIYPVLSGAIPTTVPVLLPPAGRRPEDPPSMMELMRLPFRHTFAGAAGQGWADALPPHFLALLPLIGRARRSWRLPALLATHALAAGLIAFWVVPEQARLALPLYAWLALGAAGALVALADQAGRPTRPVLLAVAAAPLLLSLGLAAMRLAPRLPVLAGRESRAEFLARRVSGWEMLRYIDSRLPERAKILQLSEVFYHLPRECLIAAPYLQSPRLPLWPLTAPRAGWEAWDRLGITHVLIPTAGRDPNRYAFLYEHARWGDFPRIGRPATPAEIDARLRAWLPGLRAPDASLRPLAPPAPPWLPACLTPRPRTASVPSYTAWLRNPNAGVAASLQLAAQHRRLRLLHRSADGWYLFAWTSGGAVRREHP